MPVDPVRIRMPDQHSADVLMALLKTAGAQRTEMLGKIIHKGLEALTVTAYAASLLSGNDNDWSVAAHDTDFLVEQPGQLFGGAEVWFENDPGMPAEARAVLAVWQERTRTLSHDGLLIFQPEPPGGSWAAALLVPVACMKSTDGTLTPIHELLREPSKFKRRIQLD